MTLAIPSIRVLAADEWRTYKRLRLAALADTPDAFGSTLAAEQDRPDTEWWKRLASTAGKRTNIALVAEVDGEPIGLAWGRIEEGEPDVAHVYQMWVAPELRRRGAGRMLLEAVIEWATTVRARVLELGVMGVDGPAARLYRGAGFVAIGEPLPAEPGSTRTAHTMRLALPIRADEDVRARFETIVASVRARSGARAAFVVDREGHLLGADGAEVDDGTAFSLADAFAPGMVTKLERDGELCITADGTSARLALIEQLILVVVFDHSTSEERVRAETQRACAELVQLAPEIGGK